MNSRKLVVILASLMIFAQSTASAQSVFSISKVSSAKHSAEQVKTHAEKVDFDFSSFDNHTRRVEINATTNPRNIFSAVR